MRLSIGFALPPAAAAAEPGEGPFDHPAARQHSEAFGDVGALDDLDVEVPN